MNELFDGDIFAAAASVITGGVALVKRKELRGGLANLWRSVRGVNGKRFSLSQVRAMRELSFMLSRILRESHGARVNAICLHNGGGEITAGASRYLTVYDSQGTDVTIDSSEAWQRVPLTKEYNSEVIQPMLRAGSAPIELRTAELDDANYLKPHYMADNIDAGIVCLATASKKTIWYISINYRNFPREPPVNDVDDVASAARQVRAIAFSTARRCAGLVADISRRLPDPADMPLTSKE